MDPKDAPAFPSSSLEIDSRNMGWVGGGMTLRDYFAAKAMQSILDQQDVYDGRQCESAAWMAYRMADAMLKAREE